MGKMETKTNVMRILEQQKILHTVHEYPCPDGAVDGRTVAHMIGRKEDQVFKTLVTAGASRTNYVFVIPVAEELNLKKAAKSVGEKSISMIRQAELFPLTGYVHGGCSPIGMKKHLHTVFDETAELLDTVIVSAGKIGWQVETAPDDLLTLTGGSTADLTGE